MYGARRIFAGTIEPAFGGTEGGGITAIAEQPWNPDGRGEFDEFSFLNPFGVRSGRIEAAA
jgi:hypothetical protein